MRMVKLKDMIREDMPLDEEDFEHEFKTGYLMGKRDYIKGFEGREIGNLPPAFVKGYKKGWKEERKKRWWDKMNARMTDLLARMGSSRLR